MQARGSSPQEIGTGSPRLLPVLFVALLSSHPSLASCRGVLCWSMSNWTTQR